MLHQNINGSGQLYSGYPLHLQNSHLQPNFQESTIGSGRQSGYVASSTLGHTQPTWVSRQSNEGMSIPVSGSSFYANTISSQFIPQVHGLHPSQAQHYVPAQAGLMQGLGLPQQQACNHFVGTTQGLGLGQQINPAFVGTTQGLGLGQQINPAFVANQGFGLPQQQLSPAYVASQGFGLPQQQMSPTYVANQAYGLPQQQWNPAYVANQALTQQQLNPAYTTQAINQPMIGFVPSLSVIERHDAFVVTAEVAGVTEKEIEVYVHHNQLTIRGNRIADTTEQQNPWQIAERCFGPFVRTIVLPIAVIANKVKAELKDGLLSIELPKITQIEGDIQRVKLSYK